MLLELRDRFRHGLLDFAWRQWAQVGVSSNVVGFDRWAIDPEALILFTIEVARQDPRLFDEILDWLAANRQLLTMQRLRNLGRRFPLDARLVGAVSAWAGDSVTPSALGRLDHPAEEVPVFSPDVLSFIGQPDPIFAEYGYIRPRVTRSGKSREPDVKIPANFAFQLRHLFGPSGRSEVMRVLLTFADGALDAARIADEAGFAKRNVNDILTGLASSRVVKARWSRNERHFIAYRGKWATLLEVGPSAEHMPTFVSWVHLFPAALGIMDWLNRMAGVEDSEYLISSSARDLMEHVGLDLELAGLDISSRFPSHGTAYLKVFEDAVDSLLAKMGVTHQS